MKVRKLLLSLLAPVMFFTVVGCDSKVLPGEEGPQGEVGEQGEAGTNGKTPYIKDGTWWIGDTNTKIPATGPQGEQGEVGDDSNIINPTKPGNTPYIKDGTWWIGTTNTKVPVTGPQGEPGDPGKDGTNGKDGQNGSNGTNGTDGKDGTNGNTPYIKEGTWWIGSTNTKIPATGPQGEEGDTNTNNGSDGNTPYIKEGTWWIGTTNTKVPATGDKGSDGTSGQDGKPGEKGEPGEKGTPGTNGQDGKSYYELYKDLYGYASSENDFYVDLDRHTLGTKKEHSITIGVLDGYYNKIRSVDDFYKPSKPAITPYVEGKVYQNGEKVVLDETIIAPKGMSLYELEDGRPSRKVDLSSYRAYKDVSLCFAKEYRYQLGLLNYGELTYEDGKYYSYCELGDEEYTFYLYDTITNTYSNDIDFTKLSIIKDDSITLTKLVDEANDIKLSFSQPGRQRVTFCYENSMPTIIDFDISKYRNLQLKIDGKFDDYYKYNQEYSFEIYGENSLNEIKKLNPEDEQMIKVEVIETDLPKDSYQIDLNNHTIKVSEVGYIYIDLSYGSYMSYSYKLSFGTSDNYVQSIDITNIKKHYASNQSKGSVYDLDITITNGLGVIKNGNKELYNGIIKLVIANPNVAFYDQEKGQIMILDYGTSNCYFANADGSKIEGSDFVITATKATDQTLVIKVPKDHHVILLKGGNAQGNIIDSTRIDENNVHYYDKVELEKTYYVQVYSDTTSGLFGMMDCSLTYNGKEMPFDGSVYGFGFDFVEGVNEISITLKDNKGWVNYSNIEDFVKELNTLVNKYNNMPEYHKDLPQNQFASQLNFDELNKEFIKIRASYDSFSKPDGYYVSLNFVPKSDSIFYHGHMAYAFEYLMNHGFEKSDDTSGIAEEGNGVFNKVTGEYLFNAALPNIYEEGYSYRLYILNKDKCKMVTKKVVDTDLYPEYNKIPVDKNTIVSALTNRLSPLVKQYNLKIDGKLNNLDLSVLERVFTKEYELLETTELPYYMNGKITDFIEVKCQKGYLEFLELVEKACTPYSQGGGDFIQCKFKGSKCLYNAKNNIVIMVNDNSCSTFTWEYNIFIIDDSLDIKDNFVFEDFIVRGK